MESCYEFLGCDEKDCKMFGVKSDKICWEVEGTLCNHSGFEMVKEKIKSLEKEKICASSHCIYYEKFNEIQKLTD